jgi:protein gp37
MARTTPIPWAHATFNGWIGCVEVSPACDNCYARGISQRFGYAKWGKDEPRRRTGADYWRQPLRWDAEARRTGRRIRVFAFSMADVFEDRRDLDPWREDFFRLVEKTPNLDWLILTKRAEAMKRLLPPSWLKEPRPNVWLGVTAENQRRAEERIPALFDVPAVVRWASVEPILDHVDLSGFEGMLDWVVVGGESGRSARPTPISWVKHVILQCRRTNIPVFVKQLGARIIGSFASRVCLKDPKGADPEEWTEDMRIREFPRISEKLIHLEKSEVRS